MRPSFHLLGLDDENEVASKMETSSIRQLWHQNGRCPKDTIPIRRTKKDDVMRASSVERYGKKRVWATIEQFEVQQHLIRLDKPVKSIKPDGDIIDCVHISHQPAFDHPSLKKPYYPGFHPLGLYDEKRVASKMETSSIPQLWHQNGRCPEDTIPIRRTKKGDVPRASFIERFGKNMRRTIQMPTSIESNRNNNRHEHAIVYVRGVFGSFWVTVINQSSCLQPTMLWVVQVNKEGYALGANIYPILAVVDANMKYTLSLWKQDPKSGNWWLQYGNQSPLGYWPSSLFRYLSDGASEIRRGGEVVNLNSNGQQTSTEMGSSHFPVESLGKASYS
ncbi:uncharacterized protein LOC103723771, partial [Phoenix dactylifera]|uniref:Uncharacterized protein LOC103723771 n=1 Tax=Phoenix dactylifera TaxID=42345 RepID=A0A8B8ZIV0_PHODC